MCSDFVTFAHPIGQLGTWQARLPDPFRVILHVHMYLL